MSNKKDCRLAYQGIEGRGFSAIGNVVSIALGACIRVSIDS